MTVNITTTRDPNTKSNVVVEEPITVDGTVDVGNTVTVAGTVDVGNTVTVDGTIDLGLATVSGTVNVGNTVTVAGAVDATELTTQKVYGTPTPVAFLTIAGTTESSFTMDPSSVYLLQSPDTEVQFKLYPFGDTPGALYCRVHANTDFPFTSAAGTPAITVSGTTGATGTAILVKLT